MEVDLEEGLPTVVSVALPVLVMDRQQPMNMINFKFNMK